MGVRGRDGVRDGDGGVRGGRWDELLGGGRNGDMGVGR